MFRLPHTIRILAISLLMAAPLGALGQNSTEYARILAEDGDINGSIAMLRGILEADPDNTEAAESLASQLWNSGNDAEARELYESLRKRGNRDATLRLAEMAFSRYDLDSARELLDAYRKSLRKGRKVLAEDASGDLEERIDRVETMLDRVQAIEVIDSVEVDAEEFFLRYPLSPSAGRLSGPETLPEGFPSDNMSVVHRSESGGRIVWSAPDSVGSSRLYLSSALLGNEWEEPTPLGDHLAEGGDAAYPFLMPDGVTLYYANDGENSLGGFDIFLTRCNDDGEFLQPANIGMPFNSPFNDYLLAIDEYTGAGWFATDRNRHPGTLTIYTFIPQDLRVNVDIDNPSLRSLAILEDISLTHPAGADYAPLRRAIEQGRSMAAEASPLREPDFRLSLPDGRVVTSLSEFSSPRARQAMEKYLRQEAKFRNINAKLDELRRLYASGDRSNASLILEFEASLASARAELLTLRNRVISLESSLNP